jgi:hypothetical protein
LKSAEERCEFSGDEEAVTITSPTGSGTVAARHAPTPQSKEATNSMNSPDEFHPGLNDTNATYADRSLRTRVHHIKATELSSATAQTAGMRRLAAITGGSVGSEKIWMGETSVSPQTASDNHHHGESETAIFVRSGNPEFVFPTVSRRSGWSPLQGTTSSCRRMFLTEKRIRTPTILR